MMASCPWESSVEIIEGDQITENRSDISEMPLWLCMKQSVNSEKVLRGSN